MDILLNRVTQQAMNYAIRSGVTITAGYALKQCGRLLKEAPRSKERDEIRRLQIKLESKIRIISPAIDMIELISARGNTSLESAVSLAKEIRYDIQSLGVRLSNAANDEDLLRRNSSRAKSREAAEHQLKSIISDMRELLARIEDAVPLVNLAITTSGVNLSTKLSGTISPSRLLQASTFLTSADSNFAANPEGRFQVGPTYTLSMYMLFASHFTPKKKREEDPDIHHIPTWKEVIHKARVKLCRVPLDQLYDLPGSQPGERLHATFRESSSAAEFAYQLLIIEDLDDDRVHTFDDNEPQPGPFEDVANAGIRDIIPIHEQSKVFYADTGKILNIGADGEMNNPVLLIKRDVHAVPPRRMLQRSRSMEYSRYDDHSVNGDTGQSEIDAQFERESAPNTPLREAPSQPQTDSHDSHWRLPADLDPEWVAFEVYREDPDSESEAEDPEHDKPSNKFPSSRQSSLEPNIVSTLSKMSIRPSSPASPPSANGQLVPSHHSVLQLSPGKRTGVPIKTSLSLLEMLMKLASLQQFRQESHLAIEDELLNFFLEDAATDGAVKGRDERRHFRHEAVTRVGFDPYEESPAKRRGEEYKKTARGAASPRPEFDAHAYVARMPEEEVYHHREAGHTGAGEMNPTDYRSSQDAYLSSPSPRPPFLERTPSKSSPPGNPRPTTPSDSHRREVEAKYGGRPSPPSSIVTPPSTSRSRQAFLRAQSEPKPRSPLGRQVVAGSEEILKEHDEK